ncbi:MAG: dihydrofolate reductase family protein [Bacteroidales bacterium]|jgi:dihydrofolate reductase|nr:dihydrofolate reductase family protein [Bacteroidales bacterium]OJX91829.1 MAG: dihydrofolate reductase [Paludibacter sp. 47-17]
MRPLSLFIATSLDGFIARPNDDLSFLKRVEKEGEDYGYEAFTARIDTILIGRKTYDWVARELGASHYDNGEREVYVMTRTPRPPSGKTVFCSGNLEELVVKLKAQEGKGIYCDGGAEIIQELLKYDLVDEMILSVVPVLLGDGVRLFGEGRPEQDWELVKSQAFETGLVQLQYVRQQ